MKKKTTVAYRIIKWLVKTFYPVTTVRGAENLPESPSVIVGNHAQMNGPIVSELYYPRGKFIWCAHEMTEWKEVHAYAFSDFWSEKPKYVRWFYKLLSYAITPLSVCVFNNADIVPVYKDKRLISTFKTSMDYLDWGADIIILPECNVTYSKILYDFQDRFIDLAKMYYKRTGKELSFVPTYFAPGLKTMVIGSPIAFNANTPFNEERARIKKELMDSIEELAYSLPPHRVVPYRNIPKKDYPTI